MNRNKLFIALLVAFLFWACTPPNDEGGFAGGTTEDAAVIANLNVAGVMQKGPFAKGSAVTVQGVDCKTLQFTNEIFEGSVKDNNGDFAVKNVTLSSACAVFEVTGVYLSEISGKKTKDELTLRALTNLKDRKSVNVNLLTHLEFERVKFLMTEKGMAFADAKKQAEKEVLAAFNVKDKIEEFETLNIFESGDGNAALLAVSVLMQGGVDVKTLEKRMDKFDDSFAEKGVWSDSSTKAAIVEWVSSAAASGELDSIRKNIENWGYATEVPTFERYVEKFDGKSPIDASSTMTDSRDGQTYRTVKIGNQVWMAENLNYKTEKSYCYNDSTEYCATYGRFYEWNAAMRACPDGWHLPLLSEFQTLVDAMGDTLMAGDKLKSTSGWLQERNGTDDYGFSILPIGARSASGEFINKEWLGYLWSSTESGLNFAYSLLVGAMYSAAQLDEDFGTYNAFPVRCLQGENDSLKSVILVEDSAVAACKTDSGDDCEYGKLIDERDHQEYKTVKIGKQVWMAENLNYETKESYCYNDSAGYCAKYGRLYTWAAALKACPAGWHLPTRNESMTMYNSVGGGDVAAKMLKSVDGWTENGAGTDSFGFTALPVGDRSSGGTYENVGRFTGMWTATEVDENYATHIHLFYMDDDAALSPTFNKNYGYSVRCVKDYASSSPAISSSSVTSSSSARLDSPCKTKDADTCEYGTLTDERDGQTYKTVKIGNQTWMAENLNYETEMSYCFNDSAEYCAKYGRLYTWDAAGKACPAGWRMPVNDEVRALFATVGGQKVAGRMLKSTSGWITEGSGEDAYGFSAILAGSKNYHGEYDASDKAVYFWTTSNDTAFAMYFIDNIDEGVIGWILEDDAFYLRCVTDVEVVPFIDSSSISRPEEKFDWSVPKEAYLNSDVQYDSIVDSRDGQVYKTVKIGNQTWMAENLNYADSVATPSLLRRSWCYGNDPEKCNVAGRLYTWSAAIDSVKFASDADDPQDCGNLRSHKGDTTIMELAWTCELPDRVQGICPDGWHLPNMEEWQTMMAEAGDSVVVGKILKSQRGWNDSDYDKGGNGTNEVGFSAIPAGAAHYKLDYDGSKSVESWVSAYAGENALFWSSTDINSSYAGNVGMIDRYDVEYSVNNANLSKLNGLSVRCVKD